jgi:hypothetical protein
MQFNFHAKKENLNLKSSSIYDKKISWFAILHKFSHFFTGTTNQINGVGHRAATGAMVRIIKSVL